MSTDNIFEADDLAIHFGGIKAVDGLSFQVQQGSIFTIIGPNGAGKTTIFNAISRLYAMTRGRLSFDGQDITTLPAEQIASLGIARTFQNIELFENASVLQNLLIGRATHAGSRFWQDMLFLPGVKQAEREHRHKVEEVIDFLDLQPYRDSLINGLPYGVRKVVEIARALCTEPKLLLLDEPASGLSVEETQDLVYWIKDIRKLLGITVIMVEHDMSLVNKVSDHVLAINQGRFLASGTVQEVQSDPAVIEAYLGADANRRAAGGA